MEKGHSTGLPSRSDEDVGHVGQASVQSLRKSLPKQVQCYRYANDCPQNSSEEPLSKAIQITGRPETYSM